MFQEESSCIWTNPGLPMIIMSFLFLIRACGAIKPCILVEYYFIMFPKAVSYVDPIL